MADKQPDILDTDWAALSPEKKTELTALLQKLDGAKLYQSAGGIGLGDAKAYGQIAQAGGLPPDQLVALSRFKMYQDLTKGDPNWQGPTQIPTGAPTPAEPPEVVAARGAAMTQASPAERQKMWGDAKAAAYTSHEHHYDSLAKPGTGQPATTPAPAAPPPVISTGPGTGATYEPTSVPDNAPDEHKLGAGLMNFMRSLAGKQKY